MNLIEKDLKYILNTYGRIPIEFVDGDGSYLVAADGTKYLDTYSGIAVNNLGHKHPAVMKAFHKQAEKFFHLSNYFAAEPVAELARLLVKNSFASKVFFVNSGTEANEAAIKLARKYGKSISPTKSNLIALHDSFHGRTLGAVSLTGTKKYQEPFAPLLPNVSHIERNNVNDLKEYVNEDTCAVFIERIQGEGGVQPLTEAFIDQIVELKEKYDFLIVVDEIQTGLFRTGKMFSYEYSNLTPDLVTTAKALGGGLPLGAMLVSKALENVLVPGDHGTTFGGNPLACAMGAATMKVMTKKGFKEELNDRADWFMKEIKKLMTKYPSIITDVRGLGFMIGIETELAMEIKNKALERNVLINVTSGNVVRLLPQLLMSREDLTKIINLIDEIIEESV